MQQYLGGSMASCTSRHDPSDEEEMLERGRNMKPKCDTDDSSVNTAKRDATLPPIDRGGPLQRRDELPGPPRNNKRTGPTGPLGLSRAGRAILMCRLCFWSGYKRRPLAALWRGPCGHKGS